MNFVTLAKTAKTTDVLQKIAENIANGTMNPASIIASPQMLNAVMDYLEQTGQSKIMQGFVAAGESYIAQSESEGHLYREQQARLRIQKPPLPLQPPEQVQKHVTYDPENELHNPYATHAGPKYYN